MGLFDGTPLERPVICERCGAEISACNCPANFAAAAETQVSEHSQRLTLRVEKRKRGKIVTVVAGFAGSSEQLKQTLKHLKNHCGAGGCVDGQQIELQGDHLQRAREQLTARGFQIK